MHIDDNVTRGELIREIERLESENTKLWDANQELGEYLEMALDRLTDSADAMADLGLIHSAPAEKWRWAFGRLTQRSENDNLVAAKLASKQASRFVN